MTDRELWCVIRRAILLVLDAIEAYLNHQPRNLECRKEKDVHS